MIVRIGNLKLFRWSNGQRTLDLTVAGHTWLTGEQAPKLPRWELFFVSHFGVERTVFTYRRVRSAS